MNDNEDGKPLQENEITKGMDREDMQRMINLLQRKMEIAAQNLQFEKAAELRDQIAILSELVKTPIPPNTGETL